MILIIDTFNLAFVQRFANKTLNTYIYGINADICMLYLIRKKNIIVS